MYLSNAQGMASSSASSAAAVKKRLRPGVFALTDASRMVLPLAGIRTTDFEHAETGRYDYAPGGGARVAGRVYVGGREILGLGYGVVWAHTVNGVSKNNVLQFVRAVGRIPVFGPIGVGGGYTWYSRKTTYPGFFEQRRTQAEWRVFVNAAVVFR